MADKILKELTLKIWRQKDAKSKGEFKTYKVHNISTGTSFLEMLDILNEQLVEQNEEPVALRRFPGNQRPDRRPEGL